MFEDYEIQSLYNDTIYMEICSEHLLRALKSALQATNIEMRLKQTDLPYLSLAIESRTKTGKRIVMTHDIPVCVLAPELASAQLEEPVISNPIVNVVMPDLLKIKQTVDGIRHISKCITISANRRGALNFSVTSNLVEISCHYRDLINPVPDTIDETELECSLPSEDFVTVSCDVKDLSKILMCHLVNPTNVICCFVSAEDGIVFYAHIGEQDSDQAAMISYHVPVKWE